MTDALQRDAPSDALPLPSSVIAHSPDTCCRSPISPGDEGQGRPTSAAPSSMRASAGLGAPAPEDVVARAQQYYGQEGASVRPGSAAPSLLKQRHGGGGSASVLPQPPPEVLEYASQFVGVEGAGRPSSAPPSGRGARILRDSLRGPMPLPTSGVGVGPAPGLAAMAEHHGEEEEEAAAGEDGEEQGAEDENMRQQQQLPHKGAVGHARGGGVGGSDSRSGSEVGSQGGGSRGEGGNGDGDVDQSVEGGYAVTMTDDAGSSLCWQDGRSVDAYDSADGTSGCGEEEREYGDDGDGYNASRSSGGGEQPPAYWQQRQQQPQAGGSGDRSDGGDDGVVGGSRAGGSGFGHFVVTPMGVAVAGDSEEHSCSEEESEDEVRR